MRTKRLGDMLLELGLITEGQLKEALDYQAKEKERLGTTLVKHHYIMEDEFQNPTPLDGKLDKWKLAIAIKCFGGRRKRSMVELLFCMLRSRR